VATRSTGVEHCHFGLENLLVTVYRIRISDIPTLVLGFLIFLFPMTELVSHGKHLLELSEGLFWVLLIGSLIASLVAGNYLWKGIQRTVNRRG
jgi:hypothetical protein